MFFSKTRHHKWQTCQNLVSQTQSIVPVWTVAQLAKQLHLIISNLFFGGGNHHSLHNKISIFKGGDRIYITILEFGCNINDSQFNIKIYQFLLYSSSPNSLSQARIFKIISKQYKASKVESSTLTKPDKARHLFCANGITLDVSGQEFHLNTKMPKYCGRNDI